MSSRPSCAASTPGSKSLEHPSPPRAAREHNRADSGQQEQSTRDRQRPGQGRASAGEDRRLHCAHVKATLEAVSYTHLDVYKRQDWGGLGLLYGVSAVLLAIAVVALNKRDVGI